MEDGVWVNTSLIFVIVLSIVDKDNIDSGQLDVPDPPLIKILI